MASERPLRATVVRSLAADQDLELIFDPLCDAYAELGEPPADALERTAARVRGIEDEIKRLGLAPMQGTRVEALAPALRRVTKRRAIIYFETDPERPQVHVLAVLFGGQDHQRRMLARLLR